jgi:predicted RNA binding protein YcfA (HicA-like mRNA interferase family)
VKIPRDISGERLAKRLRKLGYKFIRQEGSHARYSHPGPPQHNVSVPMHDNLKVGLLQSILKDVSAHQGINLQDIIETL